MSDDQFHIDLEKAWPVFNSAGSVSGQVPRMSIPSSLTEMPAPFSVKRRLAHTDPVLTPDGVTRGLGLAPAAERQIREEVIQNMDAPEISFRQRLFQKLQHLKLDYSLRNAIAQRARNLYATQGQDHNDHEVLKRRLQGLRKGEDMEQFHIIEKAAGDRGGIITGYTPAGKPIYQSVSQFKAARKKANQEKTREANKKAHAALAQAAHEHLPEGHPFRGETPAKTQELHDKLGGGDRDELEADVMTAIHTGKTPEGWPNLNKAQARGGNYHRRVTDKESGRHRYYYSEDDYAKRGDAHVSGRDVLKGKCRGALVKTVGKGCKLDDAVSKLRGGPYNDDLIKDAVRDAVSRGELIHTDGHLKPREAAQAMSVEKK